MKTSIKKLFKTKSCLGWAYECKGKRHYYCWQNSNDLGLLVEIEDSQNNYSYPETIVRKIKVDKEGYICILRNIFNINEDNMGVAATEPQLKALIKDCHNIELTKKEDRLVDNYMRKSECL